MALKATVNIDHTTMLNTHEGVDSVFPYDSAWSSNVYINGKPAVIDDTVTTHTHDGIKQKVAATSTKVKINDKFIARKDDPLECNSVFLKSCSADVFAG
jgi:uncharacterized Zn-binding protein involved in type VI secretion